MGRNQQGSKHIMKGAGGEAANKAPAPPPRPPPPHTHTTSRKVPGGKGSGRELRPRRPVGSGGIHYCRQRHDVPRLTGLESGPGEEQSVLQWRRCRWCSGSTLAWIIAVAPCAELHGRAGGKRFQWCRILASDLCGSDPLLITVNWHQ